MGHASDHAMKQYIPGAGKRLVMTRSASPSHRPFLTTPQSCISSCSINEIKMRGGKFVRSVQHLKPCLSDAHMCSNKHTTCTCTHAHAYMHTHSCIDASCTHTHAYMHTLMHTCTHTAYIHTHACTHTQHTCTHTLAYMRTHLRIHAHTACM